jgi:hypothetical protein
MKMVCNGKFNMKNKDGKKSSREITYLEKLILFCHKGIEAKKHFLQ